MLLYVYKRVQIGQILSKQVSMFTKEYGAIVCKTGKYVYKGVRSGCFCRYTKEYWMDSYYL